MKSQSISRTIFLAVLYIGCVGIGENNKSKYEKINWLAGAVVTGRQYNAVLCLDLA